MGVVRTGREAVGWETGGCERIANRAEDDVRPEAAERTDGMTDDLRLFTGEHLSMDTLDFSVNTDFSEGFFVCQLIPRLVGVGLLNLLFVKD